MKPSVFFERFLKSGPDLHRYGGSQAGRDGVADLPGDFRLASPENEIIGESHEAGRFPVGYGTMVFGMEVAPFFRLEKFSPDSDRRSVPPQAAEKVRASGRFLPPAFRKKVGCVVLKVEPVSARRDGPVPLEAHGGRVSSEMQIERRRLIPNFRSDGLGEVPYCLADCPPSARVSRIRQRNPEGKEVRFCTYGDRSLPDLRGTVISGVQHGRMEKEAVLFSPAVYFRHLRRSKQFSHIFHDEDRRSAPEYNLEKGLPQRSSRVSAAVFVQKAEALAGGSSYHHVGRRER